MASPIARLYATLGLDAREFDKGLTHTQRQAKGFTSTFKQNMLTGLGLGVGGGVGFMAANAASAAISGVIDVMGGAVKAASDLAESQAKVGQVFSSSADEIRDWASGAARDFGLSEQAALEAAGTFGNFIQALGNTEAQATDMSQTLVELAADLASFNNQDIGEVLIALRSGLAGEAEPMRRLGVSISATRVEANILAKGIARSKDEITDAMKVAERYSIILEDTSKAQGDFDRTSGGLANQQRTLAATFADLNTKLGALIVGPLTDAAKALNDILGQFGRQPVEERMHAYFDSLRQGTDVTKDATAATKEWVSGLGSLEDLHADTILGELNPTLRDNVRLWRENGEALEAAGIGWHTFRTEMGVLTKEMGLTREAALDQILSFARLEGGMDDAGQSALDMARTLKTALAGQALAFFTTPDIGGAYEEEMAEAKRAITVGFSEIRDLLSRKPRFISDEDRERNMQRRVQQLRDRANAARAAGDSRAASKYEAALASQELRLGRFQRSQGETATAITGTHTKAGRKVTDTWETTRKAGEREARQLKRTTVQQAQQIQRGIERIDLVKTGVNLMRELALGIRVGMVEAMAAAALAASNIARILAATPTTPQQAQAATAGGAVQSNGITIAGNVYGGAAGLRQLQGDIDNATRPTRRHRD